MFNTEFKSIYTGCHAAKILQKYQAEGSKLPSEGQSKASIAEPSFPGEQLDRKEMDRRMKLLSEDK
jgi:hypothetical protein